MDEIEKGIVSELEDLLNNKIVGIVRSTDTKYEHYYGLKIDDPIMEEGKILWFVKDSGACPSSPGSFVIEDYDEAVGFEEI